MKCENLTQLDRESTEWNITCCTCSLTIFDEVYSGVGATKLDARVNAAANAVAALHRNGVIQAREKELYAERRQADWLKRHSECPPEIPRYNERMFGQYVNLLCTILCFRQAKCAF